MAAPCPSVGETDACIQELVAEHGPPLTRYVLSLTHGQRHTTEDLVQETMVRAWRNLDRMPYDREGSRRWLFTVARRLVVDGHRRQRARPAELAELNTDRLMTDDETSAVVLAHDALRHAFRGLRPIHREALLEFYFHNRSVPEISARLKVPEGTVRSRVHYGLQALRANLAS